MNWYPDIIDDAMLGLDEEEEMINEFMRSLEPFIERDEHIFCEIIRVDATRKLIEKEEPELLKRVNDRDVKETLYAYMQEAEEKNKAYLIRPLPGEANFFHKIFSAYLEAEDTVAFLKALFKHHHFKSYYLPEEVCQKAFEIAAEAEKVHVLSAEVFLTCLPEQLQKLKKKRIRLYPSPLAEKGITLFLRYLSKDNPKVTVPDEEEFSPGDLVIMTSVYRRIRLRVEFPLRRVFRRIEKAPEGVRFFIVFPINFFNSAAYAEQKKKLTAYRIEKLIFFGKDPILRDLAALVFTKEKAEDYRAEVITPRKTGEVSRSDLETMTIWTPEFLLAEEKEKILKFFEKTPKILLGEVAEVRRGYFLRRAEEVKGDDYTHRLLSVGDIKEGMVNPEELAKIKIDEKEKREYRPLKPGDIVISARGTLFKVVEIPPTKEKILPSDSVLVITPKEYPSSLLRFYLSSEIGKSLLEISRRSLRFLSLSPRDVEELPIPKLSPEQAEALAERLRRAEEERLRKIRQAEEEYRTRIKQIEKELFGG